MLIPLLGPVELERAGKIIPIRPPQVALALAAPAWKVGHVVSGETLENRIWGEQVPNGARKTLYTIITQIHREVLGDDGDVLGRLGGYLLDVDESAVDVTRFRTLAERAVTAPDPGPLLEEVLTLWRGEPLAGVPGEWVERARRALGEERKEVSLRWARRDRDRSGRGRGSAGAADRGAALRRPYGGGARPLRQHGPPLGSVPPDAK
ncbi:hypothetical protein ABZ815_37510 [Nonomuraea sp. NPDC047529]|uniref:AfsR/SARP family transcriptional regulator n=1 Tax=Nonomuraea sp. NPDC047529 TaxID=3155623 RepID=UPI0033FB8405